MSQSPIFYDPQGGRKRVLSFGMTALIVGLTVLAALFAVSVIYGPVFVVSSSKPQHRTFLPTPATKLSDRAALQVARDQSGSTILEWDVNQDSITEHDRRHAVLRNYLTRPTPNNREVAQSIRHLLEAFLRVAYPDCFPPETQLGTFQNLCQQRLGTPGQILGEDDVRELNELTEYAHRFHHDTNMAWETERINDGELMGFVDRTLRFTRRRM